MKTKLIFSTETKDTEQWTDLPFIPRINDWFSLKDILNLDILNEIKKGALCWSGIRGTVQSVEYRHNTEAYYAEIYIWCED